MIGIGIGYVRWEVYLNLIVLLCFKKKCCYFSRVDRYSFELVGVGIAILMKEDWVGIINIVLYANTIGTVSEGIKLISMLVSAIIECLL